MASGPQVRITGRTYDCTAPDRIKPPKAPCGSGRSTYESGQCILFENDGRAVFGMIITLGQDAKGVLNFEAEEDGILTPAIYSADHFQNDADVVIETARIVPDLSSEHVGFGRYLGRSVLPTLYMTAEAMILNTQTGHNVVAIDLSTGLRTSLNTSMAVYTKYGAPHKRALPGR